ncbi:TPR repeat protein [Inquilinus ginsengisoli]|uniref:TPR repeat protein n=1 Tax=Inquilinus ginsengisoli TaxID=363840 RepID=A0ABU1JHZ6_9PROT|nr:SEL1-like repeat protein [Inquilinus ginsengisoli]MDR6288230.1 TPR repeat protein [Inquilinus ginsengisoli]
MKSPGDRHARLGRGSRGAYSPAARQAFATLLILAGCGCLVAEGFASRRAEAAPLAEIIGGPRMSVATASPSRSAPAVPGAAVPAPEVGAEFRLPDKASAELRRLARDAAAGQADAENDLGTFFALGIEVPRSFEHAAYWYRRAADQGVAGASYNLGVLLERGLGVPRDSEAAVARFRSAAAAGHGGALNALGLAYLNGSGMVRDPAEALVWFLRASKAGNPRGAYNVGRLYESGELGTSDPRTAAGWYGVAADAGDEQAKEALAKLQALAGVNASPAPRIGFVGLVLGPNLLALGRAGTTGDDPDRILDGLAEQLAASAPRSHAQAGMASGVGVSGAKPAAMPESPVTPAGIAEIQRLLKQMNLDVGRIDGRMGRRTRSAIASFQRGHDLPVTRRPSATLLEALRTATLVAQSE